LYEGKEILNEDEDKKKKKEKTISLENHEQIPWFGKIIYMSIIG
jgi:hypothetical protein